MKNYLLGIRRKSHMNEQHLYSCKKCKKAIESQKNRLFCDACKKQFNEIFTGLGALGLGLILMGLKNPDNSD